MEYRAAKLGRASPVRSTSRSDLTYRQATDVSAVGDDLAHQHDRRRENLRLAQGRVARRGASHGRTHALIAAATRSGCSVWAA